MELKSQIWHSFSTSGYIPQTNHNRYSKTCLYKNSYCSIIDNIQNVEITQIFINEWMDKQNILYIYTGIQFSPKKK